VKRVMLMLTLALAVAGVVGGTASSEDGPREGVTFCSYFDADWNRVTTFGTVTYYDSGKVVSYCSAQGSNSTGRVVIFNYENTGGLCSFPGGITSAWRIRVGKDGVAQFMCEGYLKDRPLLRASSSEGDTTLR
jgi:hypothetical protein